MAIKFRAACFLGRAASFPVWEELVQCINNFGAIGLLFRVAVGIVEADRFLVRDFKGHRLLGLDPIAVVLVLHGLYTSNLCRPCTGRVAATVDSVCAAVTKVEFFAFSAKRSGGFSFDIRDYRIFKGDAAARRIILLHTEVVVGNAIGFETKGGARSFPLVPSRFEFFWKIILAWIAATAPEAAVDIGSVCHTTREENGDNREPEGFYFQVEFRHPDGSSNFKNNMKREG